jgi:hypothetical protein
MVQGSLEMRETPDKTSYHVSHMLLPIRLVLEANNCAAVFANGDHSIRFLDIFFPPELTQGEQSFYALHMGTIICPLTVRFRSYGPSGDHRAQVANRFSRHYQD